LTSNDQINTFLHYNYLPKTKPDNYLFEKITRCSEEVIPETVGLEDDDQLKLVEVGVTYLKKAIEENVEANKTHVVPLSGGLDSRAILAALIEMGLKDRIITVTLGVPNSLDFDLGVYVAKKAGVKNEPINLNQVNISFDDLYSTAGAVKNCTYLSIAHYHKYIYKRFGSDVVYWSGFLGGELAGQNLPKSKSENWKKAVARFNSKNRYCRQLELTEPGFGIDRIISKVPFSESRCLSYDDQLVLGIRQQYCLIPALLPNGYVHKTPYLNNEWLRFILNVPLKYRQGEFLYKEILKKAYPKMFLLGVKNNIGLPLVSHSSRRLLKKVENKVKSLGYRICPRVPMFLNPRTLLLDYNRAFKERDDYKKIVYENLMDLKARDIVSWIDVEKLWKEHQYRIQNRSWELLVLASLEIYLKAKKIDF